MSKEINVRIGDKEIASQPCPATVPEIDYKKAYSHLCKEIDEFRAKLCERNIIITALANEVQRLTDKLNEYDPRNQELYK